jgi:hypothetical protein
MTECVVVSDKVLALSSLNELNRILLRLTAASVSVLCLSSPFQKMPACSKGKRALSKNLKVDIMTW